MATVDPRFRPGPIALFGSGEKSPQGRKVFKQLFDRLSTSPRISVLETPAGFELNSAQVAGEIADFIEHHLQNYHPRTAVIPARKREGKFSTQKAEIVQPLLGSTVIFMGPGSPSYAIRQLENTLTWDYLRAAHRTGAALALASASSIALSSYALPVYEIYKVGEELHWLRGLDLLGPFGLQLVIIPHWNNQDGGDSLDTSRCYLGQARFTPLLEMLPTGQTVLGIDERTGLVLDLQKESCQVIGIGSVTVLKQHNRKNFSSGSTFPIHELGPFHLPSPDSFLGEDLWQQALLARKQEETARTQPPPEVIRLADERLKARVDRDWKKADRLRELIQNRGWTIQDTDQGYRLSPRQ